MLQCVIVGERRLTADDVQSELRKKDKEVDELHGRLAAGTSELAQVKMDLDWAKDSQRRAENALVQKRTRKAWSSCFGLLDREHLWSSHMKSMRCHSMQVNGENYTLEEACRELERIMKENQILKATDIAKEKGEILVVCGSVFLMAEAREALGIVEPRDSDYIAEMAGAGVRHGQENFGNTTIDDMKKI